MASKAARHLTRVGLLGVALLIVLALPAVSSAASQTVTFSASETISVPPASSFAGQGGGDGWAVALTPTAQYNVFHHSSILQVACHLQSDASPCWSPKEITDGSGNDFATGGQPGLFLDQNTGHLFVYATRDNDDTAGVVCIDTTQPASNPDPFCGFTPLSAVGDAPISGNSYVSNGLVIGSRFFAFNNAPTAGTPSGTQDKLMCFDLTTDAACGGQPFAVNIGSGAVDVGNFPPPAVSDIGTQMIIPITVDGDVNLACFDTTTNGNCAGSWPLTLPAGSQYISGQSGNGAAFPLLDSNGNLQGLCLPTVLPDSTTDPCYTLGGGTATTPANMPSAVVPTSPWNGTSMTIGPRVYIPDGRNNQVDCFDYSTGSSCVNFPKDLSAGLELLYTVNPDPQRPTCIWVNADGGSAQIQNFDAFTGGECGQGATRVLAASIVAPGQACVPSTYTSLQVLNPARNAYTDGTVAFDDPDGNPIPGAPTQSLDNTGTVNLQGLGLNTNLGLPQFIITLNGGSGAPSSVTVKLTWTGQNDPSCVKPGTQVTQPPPTSPTVNPPINTSPPVISGTPRSGHTLSCSTGQWSGNPTSFKYQWNRDGTAIQGANKSTYVAQAADEGSRLTCTVTAFNGSASGGSRTSASVLVAEPGTLRCPKPSGHVRGLAVGPLTLGNTRSHARTVLHKFDAIGDTDKYCLFGGWGIRAGYPGHRLLTTLSKQQRKHFQGKIVLILTARAFYSLDGVHPGTRFSRRVARRLHLGKGFKIGANTWYLFSGKKARGVLKVHHGVIQEVGFANKQLTAGPRHSQFVFLNSFNKA